MSEKLKETPVAEQPAQPEAPQTLPTAVQKFDKEELKGRIRNASRLSQEDKEYLNRLVDKA